MSSESPYAAPKSSLSKEDSAEIYSHRKNVIFESDIAWPCRCYKCNAETTIKKTVKISYVNPWIYLTLLITPIVTIILGLIFQKKFTVELPVCELHMKKHRKFVTVLWFIVAVMVGLFVFSLVANSALALTISLILLLIVVITAIAGRMIYVRKYKNKRIWLGGTGKAFLASLPEYIG